MVAFEAEPGAEHLNPFGTVHGGYSATLLDSACALAVMSKLSADQACTTLDLKVSYLKAMKADAGRLRAVGRVTSLGRRAAFAEATVEDRQGRVYASATSTLLVMEG